MGRGGLNEGREAAPPPLVATLLVDTGALPLADVPSASACCAAWRPVLSPCLAWSLRLAGPLREWRRRAVASVTVRHAVDAAIASVREARPR